MNEWKEVKLGDLGTVVTGKTPSKNNPQDWGDDTMFITPSDYGNYRKWADDSIRKLSTHGVERLTNKVLPVGSILVTCIGSDMGRVVMNRKDAITNQQINSIVPNTDVVNPDFTYYLLVDLYETLRVYGGDGTAVPIVNKGDFEKIGALIPEKAEQNSIAEVLSSLDDKIDLLHRQNQTLEQMAETLFRQWFVEEADESWEIGVLGDVIEIFDNKRVPLSKIQRNNMKDGKLYPYYGAASIMDYVNDYIFDGEYILLGEDGTVRTEEGYPILQYATGKFWVNNHTHIFKAKEPYNNFFICNFLSKKKIDRIITGAVQPKINQGNLKSLEFPSFPREMVEYYKENTIPILSKINKNKTQIQNLTALRDTLLPKLMSGEVRVFDKPVTVHKKSKEARSEFKEAVLIANIVRSFFTPKIGNVSRQWYQKIAYLHKRKLKELADQQSVIELTTEYSKKAAGPYKKKMRYQGAEGICVKNKYLEAVNDHAFRPSDNIDKIDKYFDKYWDRELFENWTTKKFRFVPVWQLGVYATVDYSLLELKKQGRELSVSNVIDNFSGSKEWKPKKDQPEFSPQNMDQAIIDLKTLYSY